MENKYIQITDTVYKIIDFFPEGEPLKNKTKEKALEIMEKLVLVSLPDNPHPNPQKGEIATQVLNDIEVLKSYLNFGKIQGWVDNLNLLIILKEYDKIKEEIKSIAVLPREEAKSEKIMPVDKLVGKEEEIVDENKVSTRQEEILRVLKTQGKAQVADFKKVMSNVSKRTLRRDLDDLLKRERVVRVGEWNQVFYQIPENSDRTHQMS